MVRRFYTPFSRVLKGDVPGHIFHGNQWTTGEGGHADSAAMENGVLSDLKELFGELSDHLLDTRGLSPKTAATHALSTQYAPKAKRYVAKQVAAEMAGALDADKMMNQVLCGMGQFGNQVFPNAYFFKHEDKWKITEIGGTFFGQPTLVATDQLGGLKSFGVQATPESVSGELVSGDDPRIKQFFREQGISRLVSQWARTSNDNDSKSLVLQRAAKEEFGLEGTKSWAGDNTNEVKELYQGIDGKLCRAFLRAQYNVTQKFFADRGIKTVDVYRGFNIEENKSTPSWAKKQIDSDAKVPDQPLKSTASIPLRPLSAFSYDKDVATRFSNSYGSYSPHQFVISAKIPVSRILSMPLSGLGCLDERELVVLGGKIKADVEYTTPEGYDARLTEKSLMESISKGDVDGHIFHGNQYEQVGGSAQTLPLEKLVRAWSITDSPAGWRNLDQPWSQQLQNAVLNAPPSKIELFSGVSVPSGQVDKLYGVGKKLEMTLASFTSKQSVANDFASKREGYNIYSTPKSNLKLVLHLPIGTRALDANQYGGVQRFHEHIVSGNFVVATQKTIGDYTHIYLQPDTSVVKKGDTPGHQFHGNQWTTVGNITTEVASFLSTNANKFYKSGGTTKTYNGPTTDISEATIKGIGDKARELENQLAQTTDPKEQEQVRRLAMGYERMESALRDIVAGQPGIVAYDKNGEIASVMTLANSKTLQTGKPYVKVLELGSTNKTPGSATTLEIEAAKYAANKGVFLWANYTGNSRGYHQLIGRNLDSEWSGSSEWTADECKAIASLNLGAPDAITKGDFEGHPFRGNQWEAGISSGDAELTRNKEALESSIKGLAIDVLEKAGKHTTAALARNGMGDPTQNNDAASGLKANLSADIAQRLGNRFDSKLLGRVASELDDKQVGIAAHLTTNDRYIKNGLTGAYEYLGNVKDPNFLKDSWLQRETNVSVQVGPGRYESKPSGKTTAEERYNNGEPGPTNFMGSIIVAGDDPELAKHFREEGVSRLIALWAKTSNGKGDSYGKSLTLQEAARREFGLQNTMQWALTPEVQKSVDNAMKKNGDLYQAFLRAQYDSTQELLKSKGITKLPLYRGMAWGSEFQKPDWAKQGGKTTLELRPLSSWTYNKSVAAKFARLGYEVKGHNIGQNGNVIEATVPAERILSIPATGVGCLNENEVVVLGGKEEVNVRDAGPLAMREGNYIDSPLPDEVKEENQ